VWVGLRLKELRGRDAAFLSNWSERLSRQEIDDFCGHFDVA